METWDYKKTLLLKLYLKLLTKTPYVYLNDKENIKTQKNSIYTIKTLLFNKPYQVNYFKNDENEEINEEINESEIINNNIEIYNMFKDYNELIKNVDISDIDINKLKEENQKEDVRADEDITYEEMLELVFDFYNSLPDKEIKNSFMKYYNERNNNIRLINHTSYSFLFPTIEYELITLDVERGLYKSLLYALIHEYGHGIQTSITKRLDMYGTDYKPVELMPIFFNMLSNFYFDNEKTYRNLNINEILEFVYSNVNYIKDTEEIINKGFDNYKDIHENEYNNYLNNNLLYTYSYLIPMLTSFELLTKYKDDPEKSMNILKNIVNKGKFINDLKDNNIYIGESTNEAIKMLKKQGDYHEKI